MHSNSKKVLLVSMPFAETSIPSIQLALLQSYLQKHGLDITTRHLYLKAADVYGLSNYNFLINIPNDSYLAQMVFSKYVFPDHWNNNLEKFKQFFNDVLAYDKQFIKNFTFEQYVEHTDNFFSWIQSQIEWNRYDIIGFTLNYGQFLPSLAIAQKIKEQYPKKTIVFGGSTTINKLGIQVLKTFDQVDFIISGEGEGSLVLLASDNTSIRSIPGLIYRKNNDVIWNQTENYCDLNTLPIPDFQSYYQDLNITSDEVQQYFSLYGRLPIELSRGCWWNNCTFCNIQAYHKKYREKTVERFVDELDFLSEQYKMLTFQILGNTLPQQDYQALCKQIIELDKDFTFYIEARAGQLTSQDYILLRNAGFTHIQTGIEAFSSNYLKKMNKGARLIDNIAALKYCKENNIHNSYNIIINYPNEERLDYEQTKNNIQYFKQYLDPPQISTYTVAYGSPMYNHPEKFNIAELKNRTVDTIMYPHNVLKNNFCFFYSFKRKKILDTNDWERLVHEWKEELEKQKIESVKQNTIINKLIFYYVDGGNFLKIYDKRIGQKTIIYVLDDLERKIFLACIDIASFETLKETFSQIPDYQLAAILHTFEKSGIVFKEDDFYLSLPLCSSHLHSKPLQLQEQTLCVA